MAEPWLKLDTSLLSNPKVMRLSAGAFKAWIVVLCETKRFDQGDIVPRIERLAFSMHQQTDQAQPLIDSLAEAGLIDWDDDAQVFRVHDWDDWQRVYPSDSKEARAERQRKSRASRRDLNGHEYPRVRPSGERQGGHDSHDSHDSHEQREEKKEKRLEEGYTPPIVPPSRSARVTNGTRIPADWPLTVTLVDHATTLGIDEMALATWHLNYHDYWSQRTKDATSRDWTKHEKTRMSADVREGRLTPSAVATTPPSRGEMRWPSRVPSREMIVPGPVQTGLAELTPAEVSYNEFLRVMKDEIRPDDVGEVTAAVVKVFGGWEVWLEHPPPTFPMWVGAFQRSQGVARVQPA
jgi:hypothetical protein